MEELQEDKRPEFPLKDLGCSPQLRPLNHVSLINGGLVWSLRRAAAWHRGGGERAEVRGTGREPGLTQEVSGGGGGGGCGGLEGRTTHPLLTPTPPTHPRHSARHLKALVTHSSTPATSGVIQFPRQWGRVKFHLHVRAKGARLSLPTRSGRRPLHQHALFTAMFGCAPPNLHNKQQGVGKMMQTVKISVSCLGGDLLEPFVILVIFNYLVWFGWINIPLVRS